MIEFFEQEKYDSGYSTVQKIIYGSALSGAGLMLVGLLIYIAGIRQVGGSLLILGLLTGIIPYGLISFLKTRAIREMEDQFPSFLNDLAESKRGGMTMLQSFDAAKDTDYGRLNKQIEKIYNELTWGIPFPEVMERFSKRMEDSPVIQESTSIILQSFKSGGDITKTIESIGEDAARLKETIQNKDSNVKQQILIMYVIYLLFIGITVGIYMMLSQLLGLGSPGEGVLQDTGGIFGSGGGGGGTPNYCGSQIGITEPFCSTAQIFGFVPGNVTDYTSDYAEKFSYGNMAYYKSLLFTMLMIQGACTGAVAGQIGDGSPSAGIKHAMIMIPIAFVIFMFAVGFTGV